MKKHLLLILLFSSVLANAQWDLVNSDSVVTETTEIQFINADTGYVSGGQGNSRGFFLKTIDGGNTWKRSDTIYGGIRTFYFLNDTLGYAGGTDGMVNKTIDGGQTWAYLGMIEFAIDFRDIYFFNENEGIAINHNVYKTIDGGVNWIIMGHNKKYYVYFRDGYFPVGNVGYAFTGDLLKTYDNANTWDTVSSPASLFNANIGAMYFLTEERGFLAGDDGFFAETYDGGNSWGFKSFTSNHINEIVFINDSIGFCSTENYGPNFNYTSDLFYTLDGGVSWFETTCPDYISKMYVLNDSTIITSGMFGKIYKFSNPLDYVTSIAENSSENTDVKVFPNPANDYVNIEFPQTNSRIYKLSLYSMDGKLIKEIELNNNYKLDISNMESGVYFCQIQGDSQSKTVKILKR